MVNLWRFDRRKFLFSFDSKTVKIRVLQKQPWIILDQTLLMQEITETNYLQDPILVLLPLWVTLSGLPLDYLSWETVRGIANMVGLVDTKHQPPDMRTGTWAIAQRYGSIPVNLYQRV